jgi:hypothetical protein
MRRPHQDTGLAQARLDQADRERRRLMARATPPEACGTEMPVAPARGPVRPFMPVEVHLTDAGNWRETKVGHDDGTGPRHAARVRDVFDRLGHRLTPGQVETGRRYRDLIEAVQSSDMRAVRLDGAGGGASRDDVSERRAAMRAEVEAMQRRIGGDVVLSIRRIRPSGRDGRREVTLVELVDRVCLGDRTPLQVMLAAGWARDQQRQRGLVVALGEALDRMAGYAPRSGRARHG